MISVSPGALGAVAETSVPLAWVIAEGKMAGAVSAIVIWVSANPAEVVTRKVAGPTASSGNAALICPGEAKFKARGVPFRVTVAPASVAGSGKPVAWPVPDANPCPKMVTREPVARAGWKDAALTTGLPSARNGVGGGAN